MSGDLEDASPVERLARSIRRALEPLDVVRIAYLFGSRARGAERPDSDLDIAVLLRGELDGAGRERALLDVVAALTDALGPVGERADVLDLASAGSSVAFRAIRDGRRVLERDPAERVRLEVAICRRFDDEAPSRELFRRAAVAAARRLER